VTFAVSLLERVIEEQAGGDPAKAEEVRAAITRLIGTDLSKIKPGSEAAARLKEELQRRGAWSQYMEVGIGQDAEVFSKSQPMSSVGFGADIGLLPASKWNNPEPEIVLAVNSRGDVVGATLGNDVNLRDIEGRSALLLGKCKDNNGSCAIGPFIRLFDERFTLDSIRETSVSLRVEGTDDGFLLDGISHMREISRDPLDLVSQTWGKHHQYPVHVVPRHDVLSDQGSRRAGWGLYASPRRPRDDQRPSAWRTRQHRAAVDSNRSMDIRRACAVRQPRRALATEPQLINQVFTH
jgi:fumarylacetoacetate (FAA) hydrolase family protein